MDATAWAVLALLEHGEAGSVIEAARRRVAGDQLRDGRVPVVADHPEAVWPTPLAVLAWQGSSAHQQKQARAVEFLLTHSGSHPPFDPDGPLGHDTSIRGWPWVMETHSWVAPTSLCILALQLAGHGQHERVLEAASMLTNRRLSSGGWNYGNTTVYGQQLRPLPDTTGMALSALAGRVSREWAASSIDYLENQVSRIRTPLSLGWGLLGLASWGVRPAQTEEWVLETLNRQDLIGPYDTAPLALLLLSHRVRHGLLSVFYRGAIYGR